MSDALARCTRCVLSARFPRISFDEHGVCNFCRGELGVATDERAIEAGRETMADLVQKYRGTAEYDAVMCLSGGKDSTYTLMLTVRKYGLRVLAFTLDNGFIPAASFRNIQYVVDSLGVDHLTLRPSAPRLRAIIKATALNSIYNPKTLTRISAICNSCISIVNVTALKLALEKRSPFIVSGFTLGQIPANSIIFQNNYRFLEESRQASLDKLRRAAGDFVDDYFCIPEPLLAHVERFPYNLNPLCLEDISESEILAAIAETGWTPPPGVDGCSTNCQLNTFNNYVHQKRYGYNPYELELSHLIRKGQLTREEALNKINDQPPKQREAVMAELGIQESDL